MLTFGFSTLTDLLSWIVAFTLGAKLIGTIVLLSVDKQVRYRAGWGTWLWWIAKLTPFIAIPCLMALCFMERQSDYLLIWMVMLIFALVVVPIKIRQRKARLRR